MKKIVQTFLLLLFGTTLGLFIGESVIRIFFKERIVLFPRYQTVASYESYHIRKNIPYSHYYHSSIEGKWSFVFNSNGFRNNYDCIYEKPKDVIRVLSIGDSHTLGYEVDQDETFSAQLNYFLNCDFIKNQVLNTGVSGFGTAEELVFLENEGIKFKPDFVILGFFRNDYEDNLRSNLYSIEKGILVATNREYIPGVYIQDRIYQFRIVKWLSEHSYLYSFTFNCIWNYYKRQSRNEATSTANEYAISINQKVSEYQIQLCLSLLKKIYNVCKQNNSKLIIVDIPSWNLDSQIKSSIDDVLLNNQVCFYDYIVKSEDIIKSIGVTEVHRYRGHHHISPIAHKYIALECAKYIKTLTSMHNKD